ncbi:MAG: 4Fe-4S binding protein, partial [Lachnospiraceae bacterium]|nr:4Fe-4S binding protein [Lachnospiraceae bacterium]
LMKNNLEELKEKAGMSRRDFLKGAGAMGVGLGMMPVLNLLGVTPKMVAQAEEASEEIATADSSDPIYKTVMNSDSLLTEVCTESEVTSDLTLSDGTVIPAVYVCMRNRINRIGRGIGSTPSANSWDMIMYLWSEEDAENYLKMPLHKTFTVGDYAAATGLTEDECSEILEDQANRNLIWRMRRGGLAFYSVMPYINGFWEFNELSRYYSGEEGSVAEFDSQGITGVDPNGETGFDTTFPLFRTYPISADVVEEDELQPYQDWRALIKRNTTITVSVCQCRTMWNALGVEYPEEHPLRTCLSLGEMAEYFIENGIGEQITQDEAIEIVEDIIDKGMVVESICAKNADIICCCHCESCGNLMGWRAVNGAGVAAEFFSAYNLKYDKDVCIKCGACIDRCPMNSITFGDDGYCVMDAACVRCGQCVAVCPVDARILAANPDYPTEALPEDYLDCNKFFAKERMQRGQLVDFTDSTLEV